MYRFLLTLAIVAGLHIPGPGLHIQASASSPTTDDISHPDRWQAGAVVPVYLYAAPEWHQPVLDTLAAYEARGYAFELIEAHGEADSCPFVEVGIVYCTDRVKASWQGVATPTIAEQPAANAIRITFNTRGYLNPDRVDPAYFLNLAAHETAHALGFGHDRMGADGFPL